MQQAHDYQPPTFQRKAVIHGHCHHKAIMKMTDEEALLSKMGLDYQVLDSGCCGMAGAFGFEKGEHYDVAVAAGERVLLPAIRDADKDALVIANGFSCREQIRQGTDREALHIAQVLQMAKHGGERTTYPERQVIEARPHGVAAVVATGTALAGGALARGWLQRRRRSQ